MSVVKNESERAEIGGVTTEEGARMPCERTDERPQRNTCAYALLTLLKSDLCTWLGAFYLLGDLCLLALLALISLNQPSLRTGGFLLTALAVVLIAALEGMLAAACFMVCKKPIRGVSLRRRFKRLCAYFWMLAALCFLAYIVFFSCDHGELSFGVLVLECFILCLMLLASAAAFAEFNVSWNMRRCLHKHPWRGRHGESAAHDLFCAAGVFVSFDACRDVIDQPDRARASPFWYGYEADRTVGEVLRGYPGAG